jgi:ABC-type multidrug transport system fused ATPase/permease subunit
MNWPAVRYLGRLYRAHYPQLGLGAALSLLQSLLVVPAAWLIGVAFDQVLPSGDLRRLMALGLVMLGLNLGYQAVSLLARRQTTRLSRAITVSLRGDLLEALFAQPRAFYGKADWSRLQTLLAWDTERLEAMNEALVGVALPSAVLSLALAGLLFYLDPFLFLVLAAITTLVAVLARASSRRVRGWVRAYQQAVHAYHRSLRLALELMELTRLQGAEQAELARKRQAVEHVGQTSEQLAWSRAVHTSLPELVMVVAAVVILVLGGAAVVEGQMTLGALLTYYAAVALLRQHLQNLALTMSPIIDGHESLIALHSLQVVNLQRPYTGRRQMRFAGEVRLEDVSFQYKDAPLVCSVTLTLRPGRLTAIFGPNGSGKSTLIYLVLGLYRPDSGQLLADGVPYSDLDLSHLRQQVGVVPQETILFPGTIRENLTYGRPGATPDQVLAAARLSTADDYIQTLPEGYDTLVGEKGLLLSGGQRQRLAIARALLGQPRLLILDEPTNHLDERAVRQLIENLGSQPDAPATLIVSHEPALVRRADEVYCLDGGRLVRQPASAC